MTVEDCLGFILGNFTACQFPNKSVQKLVRSLKLQNYGQTAASMHGDNETCSMCGGSADGEPVTGGELLRPIEQDETGSFYFTYFIRQTLFLPHAAIRR